MSITENSLDLTVRNQTINEIKISSTPSAKRAAMNNSDHSVKSNTVSTALLLAAGAGTRLQPLTFDAPKCLTEVGGIPILGRLVNNLREHGFDRLIVVIGHLGDRIQEYLQQHANDMQVDYVYNPDYRTTNNIYSLWLARRQIREAFLLVESDLVFEARMLDNLLQPDKMAISNILPWMNGTTVKLGLRQRVAAFQMGREICNAQRQYKTVNLYSLSLNTWKKIEEKMGRYVSQGRLGEYYEAVFAEMVADNTISFDAVFFNADQWYEIDTRKDLRAAEKLFSQPSATACHSLMVIEPTATLA